MPYAAELAPSQRSDAVLPPIFVECATSQSGCDADCTLDGRRARHWTCTLDGTGRGTRDCTLDRESEDGELAGAVVEALDAGVGHRDDVLDARPPSAGEDDARLDAERHPHLEG